MSNYNLVNNNVTPLTLKNKLWIWSHCFVVITALAALIYPLLMLTIFKASTFSLGTTFVLPVLTLATIWAAVDIYRNNAIHYTYAPLLQYLYFFFVMCSIMFSPFLWFLVEANNMKPGESAGMGMVFGWASIFVIPLALIIIFCFTIFVINKIKEHIINNALNAHYSFLAIFLLLVLPYLLLTNILIILSYLVLYTFFKGAENISLMPPFAFSFILGCVWTMIDTIEIRMFKQNQMRPIIHYISKIALLIITIILLLPFVDLNIFSKNLIITALTATLCTGLVLMLTISPKIYLIKPPKHKTTNTTLSLLSKTFSSFLKAILVITIIASIFSTIINWIL